MKRLPKHLISVAITGLVLIVVVSRGQEAGEPAPDEPKKAKIKKFMRAKLGSSQQVLEGLLTEDFQKISEGAEAMLKMSQSNDWNVLDESFYDEYTAEFQRQTRELKTVAEAKKLDRATLLYVQMTFTCVDCHTMTRPFPLAAAERFRSAPPVLSADHASNQRVPYSVSRNR